MTEPVEALDQAPAQRPTDAEGSERAKLRRQLHQRMLGNGYRARPGDIPCGFETVGETCSFFLTTTGLRPTRQRQRDDAATEGPPDRQQPVDRLLDRLDHQAG